LIRYDLYDFKQILRDISANYLSGEIKMVDEAIDEQTWRTFGWADAKRFAWDACREAALNESYDKPWVFHDFLLASKRMAYKSNNKVTVDSFFNNNNIYLPFLEEVIKELLFWQFFSKLSNTTEIEDTVYLPTNKIRQYQDVFNYYQDGEINNIETYHVP